jgi:hypothetical protein
MVCVGSTGFWVIHVQQRGWVHLYLHNLLPYRDLIQLNLQVVNVLLLTSVSLKYIYILQLP